jgi:hypothetical protein
LNDWGFKTTKDVIGVFCGGSDLYYKNIGGNEYLIFSHHNVKNYYIIVVLMFGLRIIHLKK